MICLKNNDSLIIKFLIILDIKKLLIEDEEVDK